MVIVRNLSANTAYVRTLQLGGTAAAASGSIYIPGVVGAEVGLDVGSGETLSYIRGGAADATLEVSEIVVS